MEIAERMYRIHGAYLTELVMQEFWLVIIASCG